MGSRGPIPKRSTERRRRNKTDVQRVEVENCTGCGAAKFVGERCRYCAGPKER